MTKRFSVIIALMVAFMVFTGCSGKSGTNINLNDVHENIKKVANVTDMRIEDGSKLKKLYGIDEAKLDGFYLYRAGSNVKADEILILKVKDKNDMEDIKSNINKRIEKQEASFKDYLPKEYDLIKNNVIKTKDNFLLFAVSQDADKISSAFDESVK
ncbi:hypothetical protein Cpap_2527 [Ruminiclostridium papyrosolvens DSM 2782]|uniref:Lipoprotein n=1 Tax=Ruminiclostridium papyrosolvens DSM 2782 TaxID=588581 RepID=F1TBH1_9FIRM|nr:DUF4358 domain-containing protein [Ruminiclostridium papyrosolvens]EGD48375.1 hypothetical protein Cpap_2527 [Ruminiclostridium papyrosolvens DSM 2782]WES34121.1 DUF4358 domain-containing protein [Ruminiclostridium papyrosolvens DSM 2782]